MLKVPLTVMRRVPDTLIHVEKYVQHVANQQLSGTMTFATCLSRPRTTNMKRKQLCGLSKV